MITLTSDVLEKMEEEIETSELMNAIGFSDELCDCSSQIQDDLSQLQQLLFKILHESQTPEEKDGNKIFELTDSIQCMIFALTENAEKISKLISPIQNLILEGDDDLWEDNILT